MGAVRLRGSAWILPETAETKELFEWLAQEVQSVRGEATLLRVERIETMRDEQVTALFHTARAEEYEDVVRGSRAVLAQPDRAKPGRLLDIGVRAAHRRRDAARGHQIARPEIVG